MKLQRIPAIGWVTLQRDPLCKKGYHFALLHGTRKALLSGGRKKRPKWAAYVIDICALLYDIEREIKDKSI